MLMLMLMLSPRRGPRLLVMTKHRRELTNDGGGAEEGLKADWKEADAKPPDFLLARDCNSRNSMQHKWSLKSKITLTHTHRRTTANLQTVTTQFAVRHHQSFGLTQTYDCSKQHSNNGVDLAERKRNQIKNQFLRNCDSRQNRGLGSSSCWP